MVSANKSSLDRLQRQRALYRRVLPSLDLKRRQLSQDIAVLRARAVDTQRMHEEAAREAGARLPMAAAEPPTLTGLVRLGAIRIEDVHHLGIALPQLRSVDWDVAPYSRLAKPHWVDPLVAEIRRIGELRLQEQVFMEQMRRLTAALTRTVQRINLFEKLLLPRAEADIRRIRVALADAQRDGVARAKIAKARQRREATS